MIKIPSSKFKRKSNTTPRKRGYVALYERTDRRNRKSIHTKIFHSKAAMKAFFKRR